ncbi:MAG TPA: EscU/YscU/HrcU family type III secretion system export apparatus switch protein [Spirochaetia bacterium]|nr:EscU/YscU/HrcU family type III secretion system export apparatus switch protein [Spirochaetia bacterium]
MRKSVALKYERGLPAPFILARGKGELADRIVELAERSGVPVVERRELAEALYMVDAGRFLPEEFFKTVAELLVFVQNVGKRRRR